MSNETLQHCGNDIDCAFDLQLTGSHEFVEASSSFVQAFESASVASDDGNGRFILSCFIFYYILYKQQIKNYYKNRNFDPFVLCSLFLPSHPEELEDLTYRSKRKYMMLLTLRIGEIQWISISISRLDIVFVNWNKYTFTNIYFFRDSDLHITGKLPWRFMDILELSIWRQCG